MTFSIYLDEKLTSKLNDAAKRSGQTRNALIRRALAEWLGQHRMAKWPDAIVAFKGVRNAPRFEAHRRSLKPPREPFARSTR
jgi:predicted transcriptional regulator